MIRIRIEVAPNDTHQQPLTTPALQDVNAYLGRLAGLMYFALCFASALVGIAISLAIAALFAPHGDKRSGAFPDQ
jgi:hypothetical protein